MDHNLLLPILLDNLLFLAGAFYVVNLAQLERSKACGRMAMAGTSLLALAKLLETATSLMAGFLASQTVWLAQLSLILTVAGALALLVTAGLVGPGRKRISAGLCLPAGLNQSLACISAACLAGAYGAFGLLAWRRRQLAAALLFMVATLASLVAGSETIAGLADGLGLGMPWVNLLDEAGFAAAALLLYQGSRRNYESELDRYLEGVYS